jgi:hypothetical protein
MAVGQCLASRHDFFRENRAVRDIPVVEKISQVQGFVSLLKAMFIAWISKDSRELKTPSK